MLVRCPTCNMPIHGQTATIVQHGSSWTGHYSEDCHPRGDGTFILSILLPMRLPLPMTKAALEAVKDLIDETEHLSDEEKDKLEKSLPDLLAETPQTQVAVVRVRSG